MTVTNPEYMNVSHEIWMMIMKIYNENIRSFTASLKEVGLNPTHFEVLHVIQQQGSVNQKLIAQNLNLTQGNITHCIRHLEKLALIDFEKHWKTKEIRLSTKGQQLMEELVPKQHELMEYSLRSLNCTQKQQLRDLLVSFENTCHECQRLNRQSESAGNDGN